MTKLHPSIVITRNAYDTYATLTVDGHEYKGTYDTEAVDQMAVEVSGILWSIEVSERPAKPRPTRIWDESI